MACSGIELQTIQTERTIAVQNDHLFARTRGLGADGEWQTDAHGAERTRVKPIARDVCGDRLPAVIQNLLAIDAQDGVALHEVANFLAQAQRMDRGLVVAYLAFLSDRFFGIDRPQLISPTGIARRFYLRGGCGRKLLQHRLGIADQTNIEAMCGADLGGIYVDANYFCIGAKAWRAQMSKHVIDARAD